LTQHHWTKVSHDRHKRELSQRRSANYQVIDPDRLPARLQDQKNLNPAKA
jgi:hypothetical protein